MAKGAREKAKTHARAQARFRRRAKEQSSSFDVRHGQFRQRLVQLVVGVRLPVHVVAFELAQGIGVLSSELPAEFRGQLAATLCQALGVSSLVCDTIREELGVRAATETAKEVLAGIEAAKGESDGTAVPEV